MSPPRKNRLPQWRLLTVLIVVPDSSCWILARDRRRHPSVVRLSSRCPRARASGYLRTRVTSATNRFSRRATAKFLLYSCPCPRPHIDRRGSSSGGSRFWSSQYRRTNRARARLKVTAAMSPHQHRKTSSPCPLARDSPLGIASPRFDPRVLQFRISGPARISGKRKSRAGTV